jgi:hypothetical protein
MSYYNFTKRPKPGSSRQKVIKKLDTEFSYCVRLRDSDENGMATCITCGDKQHWTDMDCGHFVKRGNKSTRWDLKNCGPQCRLCNSTPDGKEDEHAAYIDERYGNGTALQLRRTGKEVEHFTEHELNNMCQELKVEVKNLKLDRGMI